MDPVAEKYNATVVAKTVITSDLFTIKVKPDKAVAPYTSGQYVLLGLSSNLPRREGSEPEFKESKPDRLVLRAYSIASAGYETDELEFYISVVQNGALTPRLIGIQPGDRLHLGEKIRGHFTLDTVPATHKNVILAATGTGLAPYVSMMRQHRRQPFPFRFLILHGAPKGWELGYRQELALYSEILPRVTYVPAVSRPHVDTWWTGATGRITRYFEGENLQTQFDIPLNPDETSVFLCGNPDMIREITGRLMPLGYQAYTTQEPGSLHTEEYW
jgi:ferredoxin/flavodoxin---NADP+ reductase